MRGNPEEPGFRISTNGDSQPRWRCDGKEVFYLAADQSITEVL
jgi:hypothetical protein